MNYPVSVVKSSNHYDGTTAALRLIEDQIREGVKGKKKVLIKPNFVSLHRQLAATHVDAVKAILDVLKNHYAGKVIIAEGPFGKLEDGLRNLNYLWLCDNYDVEFLDLNEDDYIEVEVLDQVQKPMRLRVSKTVVESDYRISVAPPKTHDRFILTLTIKNIAVGSLINYDKGKVHFGYRYQYNNYKTASYNISKVAQAVMPHLGVIDGFVGMEGNGPTSGEQIDLRVAAASIHPVSLDAVMCQIMGFSPQDIGYLHFLHEWTKCPVSLDAINILGVSIEKVAKKFRPHLGYRDMLQWKNENIK